MDNGGLFSFGEVNADCAGGTINGGVTFNNNPVASLELDSYVVHGGLTFSNTGGGFFNELEGTGVHGSATCANNDAPAVNDGDGGPNSYTGTNNGCPA